MRRWNRTGFALACTGFLLVVLFDGFFLYSAALGLEERLWPPVLALVVPVPDWLNLADFSLGGAMMLLGSLLVGLPIAGEERGWVPTAEQKDE